MKKSKILFIVLLLFVLFWTRGLLKLVNGVVCIASCFAVSNLINKYSIKWGRLRSYIFMIGYMIILSVIEFILLRRNYSLLFLLLIVFSLSNVASGVKIDKSVNTLCICGCIVLGIIFSFLR